jgi:acyl-CoA dehydrogenase
VSFLELSDEIRELLQGLSRFIDAEVSPRERSISHLLADPRKTYDEDGRYVEEIMTVRGEIRRAAAKAGFYQMFVPEKLGGGGLGAVALYAVWEHLYHRCGMEHWLAFDSVSHWATGPSHLFLEASTRVQEEILPFLMEGERTLCFAMSEPDAGSDLWMMNSVATPSTGGWVLNGTKQWMTNGPYAHYALVFAVTDHAALAERKGGISVFVVPADSPGYRVDSLIKLYGHVGSNEAILSLNDVFVPQDALIGPLNDGLRIGLSGTTLGRLYNAARSVGMSRWALERALEYVKVRKTFGQAVIDYQGVSFPLADCSIEILGAHLMGLHAAHLIDAGQPAVKEAAMAKVCSSEVAVRAIDQAVQALGGMGLTNEVHLTQAWQELRAVRIADGSAEILRRLIVGRLKKGDLAL